MNRSRVLLEWYHQNARDLPWRRSRDPYAIWVSEVMLQQTRVDTATPYYLRFLERFPSIGVLAAAEDADVRSTWSGLGYYRRARMLHSAAQQLSAAGATLPRSPEELELLPGFGAYTAAAVASIAFGVRVAVVDGNVERVVTRLEAIEFDPRTARGRRAVRAVADALLDPTDPGGSNQAAMELGATVCLPRNPLCQRCPLASDCRAFERRAQSAYPNRAPRPSARTVRLAAVVVEQPNLGVWLRRRRNGEVLLPGTWEPPWIELDGGDRAVPAVPALERAFPALVPLTLLGRARHTITTRRYEIEVWSGRLEESHGQSSQVAETGSAWDDDAVEEHRFVLRSEIRRLPTSALALKILEVARPQ